MTGAQRYVARVIKLVRDLSLDGGKSVVVVAVVDDEEPRFQRRVGLDNT